MRFVCENCQTRYVVADDRIRGRTFKVRCKKCSNLILVKASQTEALGSDSGAAAVTAPASEPASSTSLPPEPSTPSQISARVVDDDSTQLFEKSPPRASIPPSVPTPSEPTEVSEWHVILPKGQVGPLPLSALIQKMVSGEMPPRSFVWRDGMEDWKRAAEVPEVARWLPASKPNPLPASASGSASGVTSGATLTPPRAQSRSGQIDAAANKFFDADPHADLSGSHTPSAPRPLLHVDTAPELTASRAGELTKFFITQAHVTKGRSPWVVVAVGIGAAVLLVGGVLGLAELGVPVPLVAPAPTSEPKIFTGGSGDSRVRDLLYGRPKPAGTPVTAPTHRGTAAGPSDPGAGVNQGPLATRAEQHIDQLGKTDKDQLSRLYASQDLSTLKLKQAATPLPVLDRPDAPLTAEQVSRTVAKFQTGYTRCIDGELKRNPNFPGGKIRIVTTIMSSGLVRQAQIASDDQRLQRTVAGGPLGTCLSEQTRRMVFPSFQGDPFDAEIPLVLSSAL